MGRSWEGYETKLQRKELPTPGLAIAAMMPIANNMSTLDRIKKDDGKRYEDGPQFHTWVAAGTFICPFTLKWRLP
ncbi:chitin synthase activator [Apiospora arundinis]